MLEAEGARLKPGSLCVCCTVIVSAGSSGGSITTHPLDHNSSSVGARLSHDGVLLALGDN